MINLNRFLLCCPLFKDLVHAEEVVGHKLLDLERQKSQILQEIEMMEQEVQRSLSKSQILDSEQEYPSRDLNQNLLSVEPLRGHIYLHYCRCQVTKMHCKFDFSVAKCYTDKICFLLPKHECCFSYFPIMHIVVCLVVHCGFPP